MRKAKYKNIIVALLMMTFIGQVVASASVSCESETAPSSSHEQMMDHSQHMAATAISADKVGLDCCPDCDCSLGGCASAVMPASQTVFSSRLATVSNGYNPSTQNQLTTSLFRPPIAR